MEERSTRRPFPLHARALAALTLWLDRAVRRAAHRIRENQARPDYIVEGYTDAHGPQASVKHKLRARKRRTSRKTK